MFFQGTPKCFHILTSDALLFSFIWLVNWLVLKETTGVSLGWSCVLVDLPYVQQNIWYILNCLSSIFWGAFYFYFFVFFFYGADKPGIISPGLVADLELFVMLELLSRPHLSHEWQHLVFTSEWTIMRFSAVSLAVFIIGTWSSVEAFSTEK